MPTPPAPPVSLHVREAGDGPTLLLLHGLAGDHTVWNAVLDPLAERFRVLAPDLRGHGRSPLPEGSTMSFAELRGDLEALLAERSRTSAHVVGLSAGAFLALDWAREAPGPVRSLVLCGGSTHCDAHTRAVGQRWIEIRQRDGPSEYAWRVIKDVFAADWLEAHLDEVDRMREQMASRDVRGAALWSTAVRTFDLRGQLGKFRTPTLALQGMDDRVVDSSHARLIRQSITGAEMRLFPNTGHMVPVERPVESAEAIRAWVDRWTDGAERATGADPSDGGKRISAGPS